MHHPHKERDASPPRRQRACGPCSSAKAKCHFEDANIVRHICDRCLKMNIKCTAKSTRSLRKPRQIKPLNSRVALLEQKLNSLTTAVENLHASSSHDSHTDDKVTEPEHVPAAFTPVSPPEIGTRNDCGSDEARINMLPQCKEDRPTSSPAASPLGLTWPQANRILAIFRRQYARNFPYVLIQDDISAQTLFETKPFLFRSVMLVAAPLPVARVAEMKRDVLSYLGQQIFVQAERTLDILQGLLICISWADLRCLYDEEITNLTYLALGYTHNLGISKTPFVVLEQMGMDYGPEDIIRSQKARMMQKLHTQDEQRAFLGVFGLISANSTQFGRQIPLRSQYIDICCESLLSTASPPPSDLFLERTIQMVRIGEKLSDLFGAPHERERAKPYLFLLEGNAETFRAELDSMMESSRNIYSLDGDGDKGDWASKSFTLHYYYLLVRLYEPATFLRGVSEEGDQQSLYRSMSLRNLLFAIKAYFETLFELPSSHYVYQPVTSIEQATFVLIISTRLLLTDVPDWDPSFARQTVDLPTILDHLIHDFQEAENMRNSDTRRFVEEMGIEATAEDLDATGRLTYMATAMLYIKNWFQSRVSGEPVGQQLIASDAVQDWLAGWERGEMRAPGYGMGPPIWMSGMLSDSVWNLDDLEF